MLVRIMAILFGIVLIFVGVAGFLPMFMTNGLLLGYFQVDALHNIFHIVTGVLAIMASTSFYYSKVYFEIFGAIYTLMGIWGFWTNGDLMVIHANLADNVLHIVIGVVALYLGFSAYRSTHVT